MDDKIRVRDFFIHKERKEIFLCVGWFDDGTISGFSMSGRHNHGFNFRPDECVKVYGEITIYDDKRTFIDSWRQKVNDDEN